MHLLVSGSPHIQSSVSPRALMRDVLIALTPAWLVSVFYFGVNAVLVTLVSVFFCVATEYLISMFFPPKTSTSVRDLSAVLTGVLLALNLPSNLPLTLVALGAIFAIGVGKMSFGGLGQNPFNPALVGRVFLLISFPAPMTTWPRPLSHHTLEALFAVDAHTGATPLSLIKQAHFADLPSWVDMLSGAVGGSMGEISAAALLVGAAYLLIRRVISFHIPLAILLTVACLTGLAHVLDPSQYANPLFHLFGGGLILGACFMATDYTTSPMSSRAMWIFGVGVGVITVAIRLWGAYPEGISFAILMMNATVPLLDRYFPPRRF